MLDALFGRNRDRYSWNSIFRHRHNRRRKSDAHAHQLEDELAKFFLHKPNTTKELDHGDTYGFAAMQGWRASMEDCHKHLVQFDQGAWRLWSYFAIFDGHNGLDTARHASDQLDIHLLTSLNHLLDQSLDRKQSGEAREPVRSSQLDLSQFRAAIKQTYYELDRDLRQMVKDDSGCVCITCLLGPEKIYLINIGDSRAIIISNEGHVLASTEDHKPEVLSEQERIAEAGGHITKMCEGDVLRVENQLAMTRVLGDFAVSKQIVPPMADIIEYPRSPPAAFVILACDGIWDEMTNTEVASFVAERTQATDVNSAELQSVASQLLDECLKRKSYDNMSVYILKV